MSTENQTCANIDEAIAQFALAGTLTEKSPYGNGHINDTFLLIYELPEGEKKQYILQRMNHTILKTRSSLWRMW